jgi:hypothetical protein
VRPTRQQVIRTRTEKRTWQLRVLVFNFDDTLLFQTARQPWQKTPSDLELTLAAPYAYDLRGGGVKISINGSKPGLDITKRNKSPGTAVP